jgi:DinB superfamily
MLPRLRRRLDRMEHQRSALLEDVARLRDAQLAFRPAPGSWCPLDVVEHLVRVEEAVVLRVPQLPPSRTLAQGLRAAGSMALLRLTFGAGVRTEAPSRSVLPQGAVTLPELRGRWERVREKLAAVLDDQTPADLRRPMMRHPVCGWLTPTQTLSFLEQHVAHHTRQLERIRRAQGFAGARR